MVCGHLFHMVVVQARSSSSSSSHSARQCCLHRPGCAVHGPQACTVPLSPTIQHKRKTSSESSIIHTCPTSGEVVVVAEPDTASWIVDLIRDVVLYLRSPTIGVKRKTTRHAGHEISLSTLDHASLCGEPRHADSVFTRPNDNCLASCSTGITRTGHGMDMVIRPSGMVSISGSHEYPRTLPCHPSCVLDALYLILPARMH